MLKSSLLLSLAASMLLAWQSSATGQVNFVDSFETIDPSRWDTSVSGTSASITALNGNARLFQVANHYGNLVAFAGDQVDFLQVDMMNQSDLGASWAPSLTLYYDEDNWVQFGLRRSNLLQIRWSEGDRSATTEFVLSYTWSTSEWYTLQIDIDHDENLVRLLIGEKDGALAEVNSRALSSGFSGDAWMILGKGAGNSPYDTLPYLRNNFTGGVGSYGTTLFDNATVSSIPEPRAGALLTLGAFWLLWRRRS